MDRDELLWASGLFEGEGTIYPRLLRNPKRSNQPFANMALSMTDEDSVRRFHAAVGLGTVSVVPSERYKTQWRWFCGGFERSQAVVAILWFGLGQRRRSQARRTLLATRHRKLDRDPLTGRYMVLQPTTP